MKIEGWKYYNHAAVPTCAPHEQVNLEQVKNKKIWKIDGGYPLLARWTSDYDCEENTGWWYVVKEAPFNIEEFSSKRRKNIRQSLKKCYVTQIDPLEYCDDLYYVYKAAFLKYKDADNELTFEDFRDRCQKDKKDKVEYWGGFSTEKNLLIGYMTVESHEDYVETCVAKYHPDYLKARVSDAIHFTVLEYYLNGKGKKYVSSGTRNINHITNAQQYKIDNFGFRCVYCKLHVEYNPVIKPIVYLLYPFRKVIKKMDKNVRVHQIVSVLTMEEIVRQSK